MFRLFLHEPTGLVFPMTSRPLATLALLALSALLGACQSVDGASRRVAEAFTPYRPEVVQGNFVSREQQLALYEGMTQLQVRELLGTPLLTSVFHGQRWDYIFTMRRRGVEPQRYHLRLHFSEDGLLSRYEGDEMPSEAEFVERISQKRKYKVPQLEATEEQLQRFAPEEGEAVAVPQPQPTPRPPGSYPPLEE